MYNLDIPVLMVSFLGGVLFYIAGIAAGRVMRIGETEREDRPKTRISLLSFMIWVSWIFPKYAITQDTNELTFSTVGFLFWVAGLLIAYHIGEKLGNVHKSRSRK